MALYCSSGSGWGGGYWWVWWQDCRLWRVWFEGRGLGPPDIWGTVTYARFTFRQRTLSDIELSRTTNIFTMFNSRHWWKPWLMHALLSGKWYSLLLDNSLSWAVDIFKIGQCCKTEFDRQTRVVVVMQAASVHGVVWNENFRTISTIKSWVLCEKSCC